MTKRLRLGVLTPSSNTQLEPVTARMLHTVPEVTAHFSRFRVVELSLSPGALEQFNIEAMVSAADLLVDARVDVIVWSGTSGGWMGLEADRELCAQISARAGIPATTSTLALVEAMKVSSVRSVGMVTPYQDDVQAAIELNFADAGLTVVKSSTHAATTSNWEFSQIDGDTLTELTRQAAAAHPDVIVTYCTNLAAANLVPFWEAKYKIPVYDSVAATVWHGLRLIGVDPSRVTGWGSLFAVG